MSVFDFFKRKPAMKKRGVTFVSPHDWEEFIRGGSARTLASCPEVIAGCRQIAELISSMTIYLMANTESGDKRVVNELSRKIDIEPSRYMTRKTLYETIVMNMLLYGKGNAVVVPYTENGYLSEFVPIEPERVNFWSLGAGYEIQIDDRRYDPANLLHFVFNPDRHHPWMGQGLQTAMKDVVESLGQANDTKKAFMSSKWKPSIIIKVDALTEEFASPQGRQKLLDSYVTTSKAGEPWLIPAEQFDVTEVRPLSLNDLAITEGMDIDKRMVASILGVPPFVLGIGEYNETAWNGFVNNTIRPIAQSIEQELTRKLILSQKMYIKFNIGSLYAYDIQKIQSVYADLYIKGIATGNEVRDKMNMEPKAGLDELVILENFVPIDRIGDQKKLVQGGE